jgi:hypothetical protein
MIAICTLIGVPHFFRDFFAALYQPLFSSKISHRFSTLVGGAVAQALSNSSKTPAAGSDRLRAAATCAAGGIGGAPARNFVAVRDLVIGRETVLGRGAMVIDYQKLTTALHFSICCPAGRATLKKIYCEIGKSFLLFRIARYL